MKGRRAIVVVTVLIVALVLAAMSAFAQKGPPNGGGGGGGSGGGGGRPEATFDTVSGTLVLYGEALGFTYNGKQYVIDFGPEWYTPNDCLVGLLGDPGTTTTLKNGRYAIELTCETGDGSQCTQGSAPPSGKGPNAGAANLWLASPRPVLGDTITVWGKIEPKEGYLLVRAWEVQYAAGSWTWWRWDGQPWQKSQLLSCEPAGEGE